jgi:hypothetical protein
MSAFICSDKHISTVAQYFFAMDPAGAQSFANDLKRENILSVNYRYKENEPITPVRMSEADPLGFYSIDDIAGLVACLNYQSCEHPDYCGKLLGYCAQIAKNLGGDKKQSKFWSI